MDENVRVTNPLTPEQVAAMTTQAPQMPIMYFNYARTAMTFFDLRIFFGQGGITPQGQPTFEEQLCLSLTLEFARVLRDNLTTSINIYEEKFGKLRQPPAVPAQASAHPAPAPKK